MNRSLVIGLVVGAVLLAAGAAGGWWFFVGGPAAALREAESVAVAYVEAWGNGDWSAMERYILDPPADFEARHIAAFASDGNLQVTERQVTFQEVAWAGDDSDGVEAVVDISLRLKGLGEWQYETMMPLTPSAGEWRVAWSSAVMHPELREGDQLQRTRSWLERASILDIDGETLSGPGNIVELGFEPRRISDNEAFAERLAQRIDMDAEDVLALLERDDLVPDWWYPITVLRRNAYERVRIHLLNIPGLLVRRSETRLKPTDDFAHHFLGHTREITGEQLEQFGEPYMPGDVVGQAGLERVFERRLAGEPQGLVQAVAEGEDPREVHRFEGSEPQALETTLRLDVQRAAEEALAGVDGGAALVAVDVATGEIRAVASRPLGEELNRAFMARYPPGSTLKIVTTSAALAEGWTVDDIISCPERAVVGGLAFRNVGHMALGDIPLSEAFSQSCNTAYVQIAAELGAGRLVEESQRFGFGVNYNDDLPLIVRGGIFPDPLDAAETAAAAIGQGRVEASPVHMATVVAAAFDGVWRAPKFLAGEGPDDTFELAVDVADQLRPLMRRVVTDGTGRNADVPGRQVVGKTGTAEYGTGDALDHHAWFLGVVDGLAFAVFVEGGGGGGAVAAPIAAAFVERMPEGAQGEADE